MFLNLWTLVELVIDAVLIGVVTKWKELLTLRADGQELFKDYEADVLQLELLTLCPCFLNMVHLHNSYERLVIRLAVVVGDFFLEVVVADESLLGELEERVPRLTHLCIELLLEAHVHHGQKRQLGCVVMVRQHFVPLHVDLTHSFQLTYNILAFVCADKLHNLADCFTTLNRDQAKCFRFLNLFNSF